MRLPSFQHVNSAQQRKQAYRISECLTGGGVVNSFIYLELPLLTSTAVDRTWRHVTCMLTGTSCKLADYEQARNEPGCKHELIAASRVCSGIHEVRVWPGTSSIWKVSLSYQRVALPHEWLLPFEIVMISCMPITIWYIPQSTELSYCKIILSTT